MRTRKFVWVLGLPGGGTSALSGVLSRLGVAMGNTRDETGPWGRKYPVMECRDAMGLLPQFHRWGQPKPHGDPIRAAKTCSEYVARRRLPDTLTGAKAWVHYAATAPEFWRPGTLAVFLDRPLEAALRSFHRYNQSSPEHTLADHAKEAGYIASLWHLQQRAAEVAPRGSRWTLDWSDLHHDPHTEIGHLAHWLGINSESAVKNAVSLITEYER